MGRQRRSQQTPDCSRVQSAGAGQKLPFRPAHHIAVPRLRWDLMESRAPKYRVCTTVPVSKVDVLDAFSNDLLSSLAESRAWLCQDGSELIFHPSNDPLRFFVEFRCQFHAEPLKSVNYGLLPSVIQFCQVHGNCIKVIRSGSVVPASGRV